MKRFLWIGLLLVVLPFWGGANNVRLSKPLTIEGPQNWKAPTIAELKFQISWDNAWRDGNNWDAVYVFLKWKRRYETDWKHVLLMDATHELSGGFTYWSRSAFGGAANASHGIFVYLDHRDAGKATVDLNMKWNLGLNGVTQGEFYNGDIEVSAHCIEMVYVPKGPFCLGDFVSNKSFRKGWRTILPEWDEIKQGVGCKFVGSGISSVSAENAADRINETRYNNGTHVWFSSGTSNSWTVEFPTKKKILWIAVTAGYNNTSYRPSGNWTVEGSDDGRVSWYNVGTFTAVDWLTDRNSYPIPRALKLNGPLQNIREYKFYRIRVEDPAPSKTIWAANISMTTVDLDKVADDAFIVDNWSGSRGTRPYFDNGTWISSADGDNWNGELCGVNYPTGFEGFFAMKYEMTQEQWVGFLNKLAYSQQKARTMGDALDQLKEKEYVYGAKRNQPNCRNGIILAERKDYRCVFACNYKNDVLYNQADDGQNTACNYLSPADMLAYADWTGLRPLSEMEFEKMCRDFYPSVAKINEYAWGTNSNCTIPSSGSFASGSEGRENEKLTNANVNANNILNGPVRSGSFAKGASSQADAGAGYWGNMELSGNLTEIYYNLNSAGRVFHGSRDQHGNGAIDGNGNTDMHLSYWPQDVAAFIPRGGGFTTTDKKKLAVSDRSYGVDFTSGTTYFKNVNQKDSTITFRLGHSYTQLEGVVTQGTLTLENGVVGVGNGNSFDDVCPGATYKIVGSEVSEKQKEDGDVRYYWYVSEEEGPATWRLLPNCNTRDLVYSDFKNHSWNNGFRYVYFRRYAISPRMMDWTNYAFLRIINNDVYTNRLTDTVNEFNHTKGILAYTGFTSKFTWLVERGSQWDTLIPTSGDAGSGYYWANRKQLGGTGTYTVACDAKIYGKCSIRTTFPIVVKARLASSAATASDVLALSNCNKGAIRDNRDGQVYGTTRIGDQCWMAENLRYKGDADWRDRVIFRTDDPQGDLWGAYYYMRSDGITTLRDNACPAGWHMPTHAETETLRVNLEAIGGTTEEARSMRSGNGWYVYSNVNGTTNQSIINLVDRGFGMGASGHFDASKNFTNNGYYGYFVTWDRYLTDIRYTDNEFRTGQGWAYYYYMPIRCVKN